MVINTLIAASRLILFTSDCRYNRKASYIQILCTSKRPHIHLKSPNPVLVCCILSSSPITAVLATKEMGIALQESINAALNLIPQHIDPIERKIYITLCPHIDHTHEQLHKLFRITSSIPSYR